MISVEQCIVVIPAAKYRECSMRLSLVIPELIFHTSIRANCSLQLSRHSFDRQQVVAESRILEACLLLARVGLV